MKKLRILFATLLCTTLFFSCTTDDITEDTSVNKNEDQELITNLDEGIPLPPTGGDDDGELDDDED
jgi:hypothetical protein